jgi:hypothetical protein
MGGAGNVHSEQWPTGWPTVERVNMALQAEDPLRQASQQRAALLQLSEMVNSQAGPRQYNGRLTESEKLLLGSYKRAAAEIERRTLAGFDPAETQRLQLKSPRARWLMGSDALARDAAFGRERVNPLVDEKVRLSIQAAAEVRRQVVAKQEAQVQAAQHAASERARRKALEPLMSLAVPAALTVLLAFLFYPPRGRPHSDQANAFLVGRFALEFREVRGIVAALAEKSIPITTTSNHIDPNGRTSTTVSTQVEIRQKFFLMREAERDMVEVHVVDWDVPLENGHDLSVVWMRRAGKDDEKMAILFNHTADRYWYALGETVIKRYRLLRNWSIFGLVAFFFSLLFDWSFAVEGAAVVLACAIAVQLWQRWRLIRAWEAHVSNMASRLKDLPLSAQSPSPVSTATPAEA